MLYVKKSYQKLGVYKIKNNLGKYMNSSISVVSHVCPVNYLWIELLIQIIIDIVYLTFMIYKKKSYSISTFKFKKLMPYYHFWLVYY